MSTIPIGILRRTIPLVVVLVLMGACLPFNALKNALSPSPTPLLEHPSMAPMQLLIKISDLPPNDWGMSIRPHEWPEYYGQDDSAYVGFNTHAFRVPIVHIVLWYRNDSNAEKGFGRSSQAHFNSARRVTPWERPVQLDFESEIADRFQMACADFQSTGLERIDYTCCVAIARYQEYISILSAQIADRYEGTVSYSEFETVLQAIDERMRTQLDLAADGD